jgi:protoheme ferro-lyase
LRALTVLLANLGTPRQATPDCVAAFLREFLLDPAVVDYPRWLWRPILERVVVRGRAERVAAMYRSISEHLVISFHGVPRRHDLHGRYRADCEATARALLAELGVPARKAGGKEYVAARAVGAHPYPIAALTRAAGCDEPPMAQQPLQEAHAG